MGLLFDRDIQSGAAYVFRWCYYRHRCWIIRWLCSVVLLSTVMFNQVLSMCFRGVIIDIDVESDVDYVLRWCCYRQWCSFRCWLCTSVVLLSPVIFNQMLNMYFRGVIDIDVESYVDCVPLCCYRQWCSIRCWLCVPLCCYRQWCSIRCWLCVTWCCYRQWCSIRCWLCVPWCCYRQWCSIRCWLCISVVLFCVFCILEYNFFFSFIFFFGDTDEQAFIN